MSSFQFHELKVQRGVRCLSNVCHPSFREFAQRIRRRDLGRLARFDESLGVVGVDERFQQSRTLEGQARAPGASHVRVSTRAIMLAAKTKTGLKKS